MLGLLGLYKDESELKHDNYFKMEDRQWRTSKIDAFGSNLAFVLYKYFIEIVSFVFGLHYYYFYFVFRCKNDETKVLTLHQERIVRIKGCGNDLCSYDKFKQIFKTDIENCDFDQMCNVD